MTERPQHPEKEKKKAAPAQTVPQTANHAGVQATPKTTDSSSPSPASSPLSAPLLSPSSTQLTSPSSPSPSIPSLSEQKKAAKPTLKKKDEALARGVALPLSKKQCMALCRFIKHKNVDAALAALQEVIAFKRAVPMKGEIPHRHGMMSGRYPVKAAKHFVNLVKGLKGNIMLAGLALDKARIVWASASWASRPQKRDGARFKRTHVVLKAREVALPSTEVKK